MSEMLRAVTALVLAAGFPGALEAQTIDTLGTRAAGMGSAFVAVTDDASAAYWNPAGFASGAFLSLVLDGSTSTFMPSGEQQAGSRSAWMVAFGAPVVGASYYRLQSSGVVPSSTEPTSAGRDSSLRGPAADTLRLTNLETHDIGLTLVQSLTGWMAVGATFKFVRGIAATTTRPAGDPAGDPTGDPAGDKEALVEDARHLVGRATNTADLDIGVMANLGRVRAGLTIRNVSAPSFETDDPSVALHLDRQIRGGLSFRPNDVWLLATDFDLVRSSSQGEPEHRDLAFGTEGHVGRRATLRGGLRVNTAGSDTYGMSPSFGAGASYAVVSSLVVDAAFTTGPEKAAKGWAISGRIVY